MDSRQQERIESLKAGLLGAGAIVPGFLSLLGLSVLLPLVPLPISLINPPIALQWPFLVHWLVVSLTGFLFGVTFRYTVRQDRQNYQLQAGTVMAFALVRGLGQGDVGWRWGIPWTELAGLLGESLLLFTIAALVLNVAMYQGWVKACDRPPD